MKETTQAIVKHVRNGDYGTSGHDQRQEREGDEEGVSHRRRWVVRRKNGRFGGWSVTTSLKARKLGTGQGLSLVELAT